MQLSGNQVYLRPIQTEDLKTSYKWLNNQEVTKYIPSLQEHTHTFKEQKEWLSKINSDSNELPLSIFTKENKLIGNCILHLKKNTQDKYNKQPFFSILIGEKSYWNKGFATDATKTLLQYAKQHLKLSHVLLTVDKKHQAGIATYIKCGFKKLEERTTTREEIVMICPLSMIQHKTSHKISQDICIRGSIEINRNIKPIRTKGKYNIPKINSAKNMYVSKIVDEVTKSGIVIMEATAFLDCPSGEPAKTNEENKANRNISLTYIDWLNLHIRKLQEILTNLAYFRSKNTNLQIGYFLLQERKKHLKKINNDNKEWYGCEKEELKSEIKALEKEIKKYENKLGHPPTWHSTNHKDKLSKCLKENLFTYNDILSMKGSYKAYIELSQSTHPSTAAVQNAELSEIEKKIMHIGLLSKDILFACMKIIRIKPKEKGILGTIKRTQHHKSLKERYVELTQKPDIQIGDLVVILNTKKIGEVLKINTSKKYRSFYIKIKTRKKKSRSKKEWYTVLEIQRIKKQHSF